MKTILLSILSVFLLANHSVATSEHNSETHFHYGSIYNSNTVVFVENQIEFAVFPDGQFDFSLANYSNNWNIGLSINSFSFNAGFNYNPYIQYDAFGAVIQIENTPIFYDHFGRVVQIGNVGIKYNRFGRLIGVGGLNVVFNNNVIVNVHGFINPYNRFYVYRPWHRFYTVPPVNYCVVYAQPYRRYYSPVRHVYYRPYINNYRRSVVSRRNAYTNTVRSGNRYSDRYRQEAGNAREREIQRTYNNRYNSRSSRVAVSDNSGSRIRSTAINRNGSNQSNRTITNSRSQNMNRNRNVVTNRTRTNNKRKSISPFNNGSMEDRTIRSKSTNRTAVKYKRDSNATVKNNKSTRSSSNKARTNSRSSSKSRGLTTNKTSERRNSRSPN